MLFWSQRVSRLMKPTSLGRFSPRAKDSISLSIILAGSLYLSFMLWGENFNAEWGPVDDHEIMETLGQAGRVTFGEIPKRLMQTEAGIPGRTVRYRPSYYALRLVEAWLWGASPKLWYTARFVMFAVSLTILWWLTTRAVGLILSSGFILYILTAPYWAGIWACLGPAETYACFATAIGALGFYQLYGSPMSGTLYKVSWLLVDLGAVIAIGSKENFVIFCFPIAWLVYREWKARRPTFDLALLGVSVIAYSVFIAGAIVVGLSRMHRDIYANPVTVQERSAALLQGIAHAHVFTAIVAAAILAYAVGAVAFRNATAERSLAVKAIVAQLAKIEFVLFAAYAWQILFNDGGWHPASRYAFPGELISLFGSVFVPLYLVLNNAQLMPVAYARRLAIYAGIFLMFLSWLRGYHATEEVVQANAKRTRDFTSALIRVEQAVAKEKNSPVVLWSHTLEDFEAIYSVRVFLRARGITNPIVLKTPESYPKGGFSERLAKELFKEVDKLRAGQQGFAPAEVLTTARSCTILGFSQDPPAGQCVSVGRMVN